jgi:hypothetical protein
MRCGDGLVVRVGPNNVESAWGKRPMTIGKKRGLPATDTGAGFCVSAFHAAISQLKAAHADVIRRPRIR